MLSAERRSIISEALGAHQAAQVLPHLEQHAEVSRKTTIAATISSISTDVISSDTRHRAQLANAVAHVTDDDIDLAAAVLADQESKDLRDVALRFSSERIARSAWEKTFAKEFVAPEAFLMAAHPSTSRPASPSSPRPAEVERATAACIAKARAFQSRLFQVEPSAVLQRMVGNDEIKLHPSQVVRDGVVRFLDSQPDFNIRKTSVHAQIAATPTALDHVTDPLVRSQVVESLQSLQTVQALTPTPDAVAPLLERGLKTALQVSSIPESHFVTSLATPLAAAAPGQDAASGALLARSIHHHAVATRQSLDDTLLQIFQVVKGSGLAAIDGRENRDVRIQQLRRAASASMGADSGVAQINLEELFGSMDFCECSSCGDVLSPTAYFVELLQYLRNNNLDPDKKWTNTGRTDIKGTALEQLLIRRPDLQHLELSCENANTVLPYIDLANEVMESFVAHMSDYRVNWMPDKQVELEVFDVEGEASSELLATPQHTNYTAYCILKNAKHPFSSLPYFQPLDAIRIYLRYLQTSRFELIDAFRSPESHTGLVVSPEQATELAALHSLTYDRAAAAEFLGFSLDEYIILTKQMFWPKRYFEIVQNGGDSMLESQYQVEIGVKPASEHWGYVGAETEMLSIDALPAKKGLSWVKLQLMKRSGLKYTEVVDLVQTRFVNPAYPTGRAKVILESIRFSYRFLQTLVDPAQVNRRFKYRLLIDFLFHAQPWVALLQQRQRSDASGGNGNRRKRLTKVEAKCAGGLSRREIAGWVYTWFDCIGKLLVLESGEGPELPIEGWLDWHSNVLSRMDQPDEQPREPSGPEIRLRAAPVTVTDGEQNVAAFAAPGLENVVGYLHTNGEIRALQNGGELVGSVAINAQVFTINRQLLSKQRPDETIRLRIERDIGSQKQVYINDDGYLVWSQRETDMGPPIVKWLPAVDTCNIDKVRLLRLSGEPPTMDDWDRIQRFLRLYRRLDWSIDEIDQALVGLSNIPEVPPAVPTSPSSGSNADTPPEQPAVLTLADFRDKDCQCNADGQGHQCGSEDADQDCDDDDVPDYDRDCPCSDAKKLYIRPGFLKQILVIKQLQKLTGIDLTKLLSLWAPIGTKGIKPLYNSLFLSHNIIGVDSVFKDDENGNFFTSNPTIKDHVPVILASLQVKANDLTAIMKGLGLSMDTVITLETISAIYRRVLLARIVRAQVPLFMDAVEVFKTGTGDPFLSATNSLEFVKLWNGMIDSGISIPQLLYIVSGKEDPLRPLSPQRSKVLRTVKNIYDGLNSIDTQYSDITAEQEASISMEQVTSVAALMFSPGITADLVGLIEGTKVYTVRTPKGLSVSIPPELGAKITMTEQFISVKGNLTSEEKAAALDLSKRPGWALAIDRAAQQPVSFIKEALGRVFSTAVDTAITLLTAGDVPAMPAATETEVTIPGTAPGKRLYFLKSYLPFLRSQLAERLIFQTMAGSVGISSSETTERLLRDILRVPTSHGEQTLLDSLKAVHKVKYAEEESWSGLLIPPSSDVYTFVAYGDTEPPAIILDGETIPLANREDDLINVFSYSSTELSLQGGRLYRLSLQSQPQILNWKTARDAPAPIPSSVLLPDYSVDNTMEVFIKLQKAAFVMNGFSLDAIEMAYLHNNGANDFSGFDLNKISLPALARIRTYTQLRKSLPTLQTSLIDLFKWAGRPDSAIDEIPKQVSLATNWDAGLVESLVSADAFGYNRVDLFRNEVVMARLQKALDLVKKLQLANATTPFRWVDLRAHFYPTHKIAQEILKNIRVRFTLDDYEKVIKPLHDELRRNQRDALIAYLLVQPELIKWGVTDANSLYEFFLIDVQMGACLQTSRIKQAISTVQSFVQRCMLGLEEHKKYGVKNDALDARRWEWMSKQTVWTANRKVFLYPENWLVPSLRDDKSPFYIELEGELLQKDISPQNNQIAFKNYLSKLDQVASLLPVGIYMDDYIEDQESKSRVHCVARTHSAPFFFFYRTWQKPSYQWTPWSQVKLDIPVYEGSVSGSYVVPVVWSRRVLLFIAQISKKTAPNPASTESGTQDFQTLMGSQPNSMVPLEYWEVKLCWSELRNGKWTQKMIAADALATSPVKPKDLPPIEGFIFIPQVMIDTAGTSVTIEVWQNATSFMGTYTFQGTGISVSAGGTTPTIPESLKNISLKFHYVDVSLTSLQRSSSGLAIFRSSPSFFYPANGESSASFTTDPQDFFHRQAHQLLDVASNSDNFNSILEVFRDVPQSSTEVFNQMYGWYGSERGFDNRSYQKFHELKTPYSIYNWELGFHAPVQLADALFNAQQFDKALDMMHTVFNPYADGDTDSRVWKWMPFKYSSSEYVLETLFNRLKPHRPEAASASQGTPIEEWRDNPFQPHVVARSRPVAYMKWVVMKYIQILVAYGDYYFRRNTLEDLPTALQYYVLAGHIYGPKGQLIPKRGKKKTETYYSLLDKWDAFSNAVVEMELAFPFSNQSPLPVALIPSGTDERSSMLSSNPLILSKDIVLANVFGFATARYFCIPDNPQLRALRDSIDDRLFKLRNCMDINGNTRSLALWEPELDVGQLVQAAASGLSLSSALNDLYTILPNYRFVFLFGKAMELCNELKSQCKEFLSLKEKRDGEALQLMRTSHELAVNGLVMELKKKQLEDAQKSLDSLKLSRKSPEYRFMYHASLTGAEASPITDDDSEYQVLSLQIEAPTTEGDLKLNSNEKLEMDEASKAQDVSEDAGHLEVLAGILHALPSFNIHGTPFGCGIEVAWGMPNLASAASAGARYIQLNASKHTFTSSNAGRKVGNIKQYQDRVHQMNLAGHEIKHINSQMIGAQLKIDSSNQEIVNQQKAIDNSTEVNDFLRNKYTNDELYSFLESSTRQMLYQTYTLASDIAKKAELAYQFERKASDKRYIQSVWDPARDGLQSGEQLWLGLKQLESAYQAERGYDFEIQKSISFRQLSPIALLELREKGVCQISLPEVFFDMDFPGHYYRRIKSVTLTIPCIVGPYTSVNATLRLLDHRYRHDSTATSSKDYLETKEGIQDPRFRTARIPIDAIAVSTGQNDGGMFELQLKDERYIPFEGAGLLSTWQLQLSNGFRQFDYDSITDVVLNIRYTACNGGDKLRKAAADSVNDFIRSVDDLSNTEGLFVLFDLKAEFASEWSKLGNPGPAGQKIVMRNLVQRLPAYTKGRDETKIIAKDVTVLTPMKISRNDLALDSAYEAPPVGGDPLDGGGLDTPFDSGPDQIGKLLSFKIDLLDQPLGTWALKINLQPGTKADKIWLLVRYVLPETQR